MRAMGEFDGAAALRQATVPVLSIGSAHPANSAADLRQACPAITIGQTVGAGHFNQLEVPDQVNAMIGKFLAVTGLLEPAEGPAQRRSWVSRGGLPRGAGPAGPRGRARRRAGRGP